MPPPYRYTLKRIVAALELADTIVDTLDEIRAAADMDEECPICFGDDGDHDSDWGDGKGCPVLEYQRAREASRSGTEEPIARRITEAP